MEMTKGKKKYDDDESNSYPRSLFKGSEKLHQKNGFFWGRPNTSKLQKPEPKIKNSTVTETSNFYDSHENSPMRRHQLHLIIRTYIRFNTIIFPVAMDTANINKKCIENKGFSMSIVTSLLAILLRFEQVIFCPLFRY